MIKEIETRIIKFRNDRDWQQFHNPRSLAMSIAIESAELLELFQWSKDDEVLEIADKRISQIEEELADIFIYLLLMSHDLSIDIIKAAENKIERNEKKYPVFKSKGNSKKYNEL
jgi:NTP pyrophosphatase (non-canonical NTP hydrolase)